MSRRLNDCITLDYVFERYEDTNGVNSIYTLLKKYKYLYDELVEKTSYLNDHFLRKEMGQRCYHYYNNIEKVPNCQEKGRNYKFLSFEKGYSLKAFESFDLSKIGDKEIDIVLRTSDNAVTKIKKYEHIREYLYKNTKYLDDCGPSDKDRIFYYINSRSLSPVILSGGKLMGPNHARVTCLPKFRVIDDFICMSDDNKLKFIRENIAVLNLRLDPNLGEHIRCSLYDSQYYLDYIGWCPEFSKLERSYMKSNGIEVRPSCIVCGSEVKSFTGFFMKHAETCSVKCSNSYIGHIDKRLSNIGKNEDKILELLSHKIKYDSFEKSKRIGPFICDALLNDNIIVEVNERHHLYPRQLKKDKIKYDYFISNGYKLLLIWDNISIRKSKTKKKFGDIKKIYKSLYGFDIIQAQYNTSHNNKGKVQILTDDGFKNFSGVSYQGDAQTYKLSTSNKSLICTNDHILFRENNIQVKLENLKIGDNIKTIDGFEEVLEISPFSESEKTYDIVGSENYKFSSNGIISHNCLLLDELAYIEPLSMVEDFMKSVLPTISRAKTSKILITSTPKGKNNIFFKMYDAATKKGTPDWNEFNAEKVDWTEIPGRDEEWKRKEIAKLGSIESFNQEYGCEFLDDGSCAIDAELFDELKRKCRDPIHILDDGHYKLWIDAPDSSRVYVAGVDVSEGVDQDASVIEIFDITDLTDIVQVGEYYNKLIPPAEFANKCHEILQHWGNPLVLIERNNQGAQICDRLDKDFGYPNIVSWGAKQAHKNQQVGMISHTNTKYKAVLNERYFINEIRSVTFSDIATLNEFKSFVRMPNGSWKAKPGEHDDRVMACVWALMILFNEITEMYFDIVEFDDFGKPLKIEPMNMGLGYFTNPTSIYNNEQVERIESSNLCPVSFGSFESFNQGNNEISDLMSEGWVFANGAPYDDPSQYISDSQWDLFEKYF